MATKFLSSFSLLIGFSAFAGVAGEVKFIATTNVSSITVEGKTSKINGDYQLQGNTISLDITVPVEGIETGMKMHDKHMRERIFTKKEDGSVPDLHLVAKDVACSGQQDKLTCPVRGTLAIQGKEKTVEVPLILNGTNGKAEFNVKLSDYGIEQPSQFGVKVNDEVHVVVDAHHI